MLRTAGRSAEVQAFSNDFVVDVPEGADEHVIATEGRDIPWESEIVLVDDLRIDHVTGKRTRRVCGWRRGEGLRFICASFQVTTTPTGPSRARARAAGSGGRSTRRTTGSLPGLRRQP